MVLRMATINEPKQIDPSDVVVARTNAFFVGSGASGRYHHAATAPAVVTWPMFFRTCVAGPRQD